MGSEARAAFQAGPERIHHNRIASAVEPQIDDHALDRMRVSKCEKVASKVLEWEFRVNLATVVLDIQRPGIGQVFVPVITGWLFAVECHWNVQRIEGRDLLHPRISGSNRMREGLPAWPAQGECDPAIGAGCTDLLEYIDRRQVPSTLFSQPALIFMRDVRGDDGKKLLGSHQPNS